MHDDHRPRRKSTRLPEQAYDYRTPGCYFVTICTQNRLPLFGEVVDGEMRLSAGGEMVKDWWHVLPGRFADATLDAFALMPNHVHGLIWIVPPEIGIDPNLVVGEDQRVLPASAENMPNPDANPDADRVEGYSGVGDRPWHLPKRGGHAGPPLRVSANASLIDVIQWYKTMKTNTYIRGVREHG